MNILFFLTPKENVSHVDDDDTLRQAIEKMEYHGYTAIPVISREGQYRGSVSEGDFLWNIMSMGSVDPYEQEQARIDDIVSDRTPPVRVSTPIAELWDKLLDQNFVPVVDDRDMFVGIVTRRSVMAYLMNRKGAARTGDELSS